MTTAGCAYAACVSRALRGCMRGALESQKGARRIFRPSFRESGVGGRFRARCAQYRARFGQTRARMPCAQHVLCEVRTGRGGRGRGPIQSVPHDSPDSSRVMQERSEDAKVSPASVSASSLATALLFVFFLVLSSPEPLFFSDFSVLDARSVPEGFVASLALVFLCGFVPAFVSEVALVLAFSFAFGFVEAVSDSTRRGVPFPGRPC